MCNHPDRSKIKIGYLQKTSLIEYPGKISSVAFTQGCNFRCPYCHNPELVDPSRFTPPLDPCDVYSFLQTRKGKCDAVVITGGEPCIQDGLMPFMKEVREMGYLVKLDTNGSCPGVLSEAISLRLVDYVAMDIKTSLSRYREVAGAACDPCNVAESVRIILNSGLPCEFRTTLVKEFLSLQDFGEIGRLIEGAPRYILQRFVASKHLDERFLHAEAAFPEKELADITGMLTGFVGQVAVR
jgi:pyruvate formate lyase activating enzyme